MQQHLSLDLGLDLQLRAQQAAPPPSGRSHKNILQESLVRGNRDIKIQYSDSQTSTSSGQQLWLSVVSLVSSTDGSTRLSAAGQGPRKTAAQDCAAKALMELPAFESMLQRLYSPVAPALLQAAATAPPAFNVLQQQIGSAGGPTVPTLTTGGIQVMMLTAGNPAVLTEPLVPTMLQPAVAQPATTPPMGSASDTGAAGTVLLSALGASLASKATAAVTGVSAIPQLNQLAAGAMARTKAAQQPLHHGMVSDIASGSADQALTAGEAAGTAGSCLVDFNPNVNCKNTLQELLQQLPSLFELPTYSYTAEGPPHARLFTATVIVICHSAPQPGGLGLPGQPSSSSAAAAAAGTTTGCVALTATGIPQSTRKKAENAAAAALLSSAGLKAILGPERQRTPGPQLFPTTPMQELNDLAAQAAWCLEPVQPRSLGGHAHQPLFGASIIINGHLLSVGYGSSKAAASHAAASRALECMRPPAAAVTAGGPLLHAGTSQQTAGGAAGPAAAAIQEASLELFGQLAQQAVNAGIISAATAPLTAVCTFLVQQGDSKPQVVALGTGTGFFGKPLQELTDPALRGKLLLDCHGEVIARRSLLRWLYTQAIGVLMCHTKLQQYPPGHTVAVTLQRALQALFLEVVPSGHAAASTQPEVPSGSSLPGQQTSSVKLRLKPGVKLHMYISNPPCGDARDFNLPPSSLDSTGLASSSSSSSGLSFHFTKAKPRQRLPAVTEATPDKLLPSQAALDAHWPQACALLHPEGTSTRRGLLRYRVKFDEHSFPVGGTAAAANAEAAVPASSMGSGAAEAGVGHMRKMCCSDKLASWNALGLQGALLGQLLEPVYISSVTLGGPGVKFCEGAICRAICCRLAPDLPELTAIKSSGLISSAASSASDIRPDRDIEQQSRKRQHLSPDVEDTSMVKAQAAAQRGLKLPAPFRVNHPQVLHALPSSTSSRWVPSPTGHKSSSCAESLNWNAAEKTTLEVCTAWTGSVLQLLQLSGNTATSSSSAASAEASGTHSSHDTAQGTGSSVAGSSGSSFQSRLSKASMFEWYHQLLESAEEFAGAMGSAGQLSDQQDMDEQHRPRSDGQPGQQESMADDGADTGQEMYAAAKARNTGYYSAKAQLYQHFQQRTQQVWLKATAAVPELDSFVV